jgi:nicotinamidase-related amidase
MTRRALLVIDVLGRFEFPQGLRLVRRLEARIPAISRCIATARRVRVPVIYVNDHWGQWRSDREKLLAEALAADSRGARIARALRPRANDYFVLKPRHSGFYATPLALLLESLGVDTLVLTGAATNSCVWFTAADAHLRGYGVEIVRDATAGESAELERMSLALARSTLRARLVGSRSVFPRRGRAA